MSSQDEPADIAPCFSASRKYLTSKLVVRELLFLSQKLGSRYLSLSSSAPELQDTKFHLGSYMAVR